MKKEIIFLLAFLFLLSQISALEITTQKQIFKQGETFLATLQGNILEEIKEEDIGFFEEHVEQPFDFGFEKIQNTYYIYATLPYVEKNYSLKIEEVYFKENNKVQTLDLKKEFSISDQTAEFYVKPGALKTEDDFTISIYNNLNNDFSATWVLKEVTNSENIPFQDTKEITITTEHITSPTFAFLEINSDSGFAYSLPVYVDKTVEPPIEPPVTPPVENQTEQNETEQNETIVEFPELEFSADEIFINVSKNEQIIYPLTIWNFGANVTDIRIFVSSKLEDYVSVSVGEIDFLGFNKSYSLNISFEFPQKGIFEGAIIAESENSSDILSLVFNVEENIPFTTSGVQKKTCAELGFKICDVCDGEITSAADGICCIGNCKEDIKEPKKRNWTATIIVVILLGLIALIVFWKLKKPKPTAKDILNKRASKNKNLGKFDRSIETSGDLSRS